MDIKRKIIEIDEDLCNGCGQCIISCAEGALEIVDGKARLVAEKYCDGLGACLGECPTGALKIVEREADDFDEDAVELRLHELKAAEQQSASTLPCGCPSSTVQTFAKATPCQQANVPRAFGETASALTHWPIQIKLVPPNAPFLKNADLLVAADCTAVAYASFHQDLLDGRVVMMGCPKFDDVQNYVDKFTQVFLQSSVKSVTVAVMEVPCCHGLPMIVRKGMELAGKTVPLNLVVIGTRGDILKRDKLVA